MPHQSKSDKCHADVPHCHVMPCTQGNADLVDAPLSSFVKIRNASVRPFCLEIPGVKLRSPASLG